MSDLISAPALAILGNGLQPDAAAAASRIKQAAKDRDMARLDETARDFEAMFMTEMLKPMFEDIKPDEAFGGGKGEEVFQGMMLQEYGKIIADTGGIGLATHVKEAMIRIQEGKKQ